MKFRVLFEQWVQECATVVIDADTPEKAVRIAAAKYDDGTLDLDWSDGSDVDYRGVTEVRDITDSEVLLDDKQIAALGTD